MPWIEGIGDEVTVVVGITLALCILLAAWFSTGIRDIPFISVVFVQRRHRTNNAASHTPAIPDTTPSAQTGIQPGSATASPVEAEIPDPSADSESTSSEGSLPIHEPNIASSSSSPTQTSEEVSSASKDTGLSHESTSNTTLLNDETGTGESGNKTDKAGGSQTKEAAAAHRTEENSETSEEIPENFSPSELRQRRLDFLSGKTSSDKTSVQHDDVVPQEITHTEHVESSETVSSTNCNQETSESLPPIQPKQTLTQLASNLLSQPIENTENNTTTDNQSGDSSSRNTVNQSETETLAGDSGLSPGDIRIRIKFLNETQRLVMSPATETIGNFRRKHFSVELSESKLVRFIFNGQDLRNDALTLQSHNIGDNSVVHCLVTQQQQAQAQESEDDDNDFDIGAFMFPLFGLLLVIGWYLRFSYRQFFNVTSTLTLAGITFLFLVAFISSIRRPAPHAHID